MTLLATTYAFAKLRQVDHDPTDVAAELALEAASGIVRSYCGQSFDLVVDDEVALDGTGTLSLLLPEMPVYEVAEITIGGTAEDPLDYYLDAAAILWRQMYSPWPKGHGNVVVTYTHGYVLPGATAPDEDLSYAALPSEIEQVVLAIALRSLAMSQSGGGGGSVSAESIGTYSVTYAGVDEATATSPLRSLEAAALAPYRRTRVA